MNQKTPLYIDLETIQDAFTQGTPGFAEDLASFITKDGYRLVVYPHGPRHGCLWLGERSE